MGKNNFLGLFLALATLSFSSCDGSQSKGVSSTDTQNISKDSILSETTCDTIDIQTLSKEQGVSVSGKEGNYTYVNLGLKSGILWATYNIGATKPTECGNYFAWGETKVKKEYNSQNYAWYDNTRQAQLDDALFPYITKYCKESNWGDVDNKFTLDSDDDAATVLWGKTWRMPTKDEMQELLDGCSWSWQEQFNGSHASGMLGTSKVNGNTIFIVAAGDNVSPDGIIDVNIYAHYWTASFNQENEDNGSSYRMNMGTNVQEIQNFDRCNGNPIRPIIAK